MEWPKTDWNDLNSDWKEWNKYYNGWKITEVTEILSNGDVLTEFFLYNFD